MKRSGRGPIVEMGVYSELPEAHRANSSLPFMERFMLKPLALLISALSILAVGLANELVDTPQLQSSLMRVELALDQPALTVLAVDSLGTRKLAKNPLRTQGKLAKSYELRRVGPRFEYRPADAPAAAPPAWTFEFSTQQIHLCSSYSKESPAPPLVLNFDAGINHATLLGLINEDGSVRLSRAANFAFVNLELGY